MQNTGQIIFYKTGENSINIEVFFQDETVWLPQKKIAELFGVDRTVITKHLKNIFESSELSEDSTCAKIAHVQKEGNREVMRDIEFYNLDVIIAVGYRVNSKQATNFRIWATNVLKEFIR
ncbi:MAG: RhuM family protein, partial [Candidatus Gracilibacteria bacterium]|nr:RhuM family protein [Candidatus Gracilibacteria bacterium]